MRLASRAGLVGAAVAVASVAPCGARAETIAEESPPAAPPPSSGGFCSACVIVGIGVGLVIAGIPMLVQAERALRRGEGVAHGRRLFGCDEPSGPCTSLAAADTDDTPFWVGGGITGGLGVVAIVSGSLLAWKVPSTRGYRAAITVGPTASGARATFELAW